MGTYARSGIHQGVGSRLMHMPQGALAYEAQTLWKGKTSNKHINLSKTISMI